MRVAAIDIGTKVHEEYAQLRLPLRRTVRMLASILRVAESLDRSHAQVISALELRDRGTELLLQLRTSGNAELEVWAARRHLGPFEKLVRKSCASRSRPRAAATRRGWASSVSAPAAPVTRN
ncbi:MAG: hypothetical protein HY657_13710 [Acidobacteria bacterium]|nr:hypothetical protein [Acidobacteriota bacterium]